MSASTSSAVAGAPPAAPPLSVAAVARWLSCRRQRRRYSSADTVGSVSSCMRTWSGSG